MSAYDKTSIQINRCKRILALVDTYVDCPTQDYRTALRKALMEEFEAPAIAPPVAAGVDTPEFRALFTGYPSDAGNVAEFVDVWGAQQHRIGRLEGYNDGFSTANQGAEKAEARLAEMEEKQRNHNGVRFGDPLPEIKVRGCVFNAEAKDQHPNAIDPSDTPC